MYTKQGIAHFDSGGFNRAGEAQRAADAATAAAKKTADDKAAYDKYVADTIKQYGGKVPLEAAINFATKLRQDGYTPRSGGRDGTPESWKVSDADAVNKAFTALGVDPALAPKNVDLSFYNKLQQIAGGRLDPTKALAEATYYNDGRRKGDDKHIPELIAVGIYQGKTGADLWKPVEEWNDSQRGSRQGWNGVRAFATDAYKGVTSNPIGLAIISTVAAKYGIPPEVTSAAISVDQGADPATIARNYFVSKLGAELGAKASAEVTSALSNSNLDPKTIADIGKVTSGATRGGVTSGTFAGAVAGGAAAGTNVLKNMAGTEISDLSARYGLDRLDFDGISIPGGFNGPIVDGVSRKDVLDGYNDFKKTSGGNLVTKIVSNTPGGKQVTAAINDVKNVVPNQINRVVNNAADRVVGNSGSSGTPKDTTSTGDPESSGMNWEALAALLAPQKQVASAPRKHDNAPVQEQDEKDVFDFLARTSQTPGAFSVADMLKLTNKV